MHPLDLAVSFYESNCVGCPHRDPTGRFPTIADESAERKARAEAAEQEQARLEAEAIAAWERPRTASALHQATLTGPSALRQRNRARGDGCAPASS